MTMTITKNNVRKLVGHMVSRVMLGHAESGLIEALAYCQAKYNDSAHFPARRRMPSAPVRARHSVTNYVGACQCEDYPCCGH